jgi:hypothetical protein
LFSRLGPSAYTEETRCAGVLSSCTVLYIPTRDQTRTRQQGTNAGVLVAVGRFILEAVCRRTGVYVLEQQPEAGEQLLRRIMINDGVLMEREGYGVGVPSL